MIWDSLCKQLGIIQVYSLEELADSLVTLRFMSAPRGRRVALIGAGGGSSVLIADEFERRGLKVPPLPQEIRNWIGEFTPLAGNILRNPIDYSQNWMEHEKLLRTVQLKFFQISCFSAIFLRSLRRSNVEGIIVDQILPKNS